MATLQASIGAYANQMIAPGITVGSLPLPVSIDSETLLITGGAGTVLDPYSITRACFGTAAASHTGGASITVGLGGGGSISVTDGTTTVNPATSLHLPAGTLTDLGSGVGGVGLITTLLGPLHIDYTSPLINNDFTVLGPVLPDHSFVIAAWALVPIGWKSDSNADCDIKLRLASLSPYYVTALLKEYPAPGTGPFVTYEPTPIYRQVHTHDIPAGTDAAGGTSATQFVQINAGLGIVDYAAWTAGAGSAITAIQLAIEVYANAGAAIVQGEADIYAIIATPAGA